MNPENHLLVAFLRFLNFNNAADQFVNVLLGHGEVNIHPDILEATDLIIRRMAVSNSLFNSQPNFQRVAEQFDLFDLPDGGLVLDMPIQHNL